MKISQLNQIIKEELRSALNEMLENDSDYGAASSDSYATELATKVTNALGGGEVTEVSRMPGQNQRIEYRDTLQRDMSDEQVAAMLSKAGLRFERIVAVDVDVWELVESE